MATVTFVARRRHPRPVGNEITGRPVTSLVAALTSAEDVDMAEAHSAFRGSCTAN